MVSKGKVWEEGGGGVQEEQVPRWQSDVDMTLNGLAGISPPPNCFQMLSGFMIWESQVLHSMRPVQISRRVG